MTLTRHELQRDAGVVRALERIATALERLADTAETRAPAPAREAPAQPAKDEG